jgi:hypothetical protein
VVNAKTRRIFTRNVAIARAQSTASGGGRGSQRMEFPFTSDFLKNIVPFSGLRPTIVVMREDIGGKNRKAVHSLCKIDFFL